MEGNMIKKQKEMLINKPAAVKMNIIKWEIQNNLQIIKNLLAEKNNLKAYEQQLNSAREISNVQKRKQTVLSKIKLLRMEVNQAWARNQKQANGLVKKELQTSKETGVRYLILELNLMREKIEQEE